jgi:tRNA(fMet)-specific endonuclease VapC
VSQIVLDTDVWSYLFKQDTRAESYRPHLEGHVLCVSFQTVAELYQWAEKANWSENDFVNQKVSHLIAKK